MSPVLIPGAADLSDSHNVVQARHELHRAIDFGGEAEQAAWARKWGESALSCGDRVCGLDDDDIWPGAGPVSERLQTAEGLVVELDDALKAKPLNLPDVQSRSALLRATLEEIQDILEQDA